MRIGIYKQTEEFIRVLMENSNKTLMQEHYISHSRRTAKSNLMSFGFETNESFELNFKDTIKYLKDNGLDYGKDFCVIFDCFTEPEPECAMLNLYMSLHNQVMECKDYYLHFNEEDSGVTYTIGVTNSYIDSTVHTGCVMYINFDKLSDIPNIKVDRKVIESLFEGVFNNNG